MKPEIIFYKRNATFEDIADGECFIGGSGNLYIKVAVGGVLDNSAINLSQGKPTKFISGTTVKPAKVKIIVEELL